MRQVTRPVLPRTAQTYLNRRQSTANQRRALGTLDIERDWKDARQTKAVGNTFDRRPDIRGMLSSGPTCCYVVRSVAASRAASFR